MIVDYYDAGTQTLERPRIKHETKKELTRKRIPSIEKLNREKELEIQRKKEQIKAKAQTRKNVKIIFEIAIGFAILFTISYRNALINANFTEKEKLKTNLASIQKQNEQLKVSIEQGMNINTIEQEAKEKLGMQKLDNSQKVYVSLEKEDYIEPSVNVIEDDENETWWSKLLKDLFNIK